MEILEGIGTFSKIEKGVVATIGVFDGVHRGHQAIIEKCVEAAHEIRCPSMLITFDRHPLEVVGDAKTPLVLTPMKRKLVLIEDLGVEYVAILRFNRELSELSPHDFCLGVLVDGFGAKAVSVGKNFHFGIYGSGDVESLAILGKEMGFEVLVVPLVPTEGGFISSTRVRKLLKSGEVQKAANDLGRFHRVYGKVVHGASRGKTLGFPTANLEIPKGVCMPMDGVYAGIAVVDGERFKCAINIGDNPTFSNVKEHAEAHIFDFKGELYGEDLFLEFHARMRNERAFPNPEELIIQMSKDVAEAKEILSNTQDSGL